MAIKILTLFAASGYVKALAKEPRQSGPFGNYPLNQGLQTICLEGRVRSLK